MNCAWLFLSSLLYLAVVEYREVNGLALDDLDFVRSAIDSVAKSITSKPVTTVSGKRPKIIKTTHGHTGFKGRVASKRVSSKRFRMKSRVSSKRSRMKSRVSSKRFRMKSRVSSKRLKMKSRVSSKRFRMKSRKLPTKVNTMKVATSKPRNLNKYNEAKHQVERAMAQAELSRQTAKLSDLKKDIINAVNRGNVR